jgi:membrane-associated protease RseP (regulator of RpoE activity)
MNDAGHAQTMRHRLKTAVWLRLALSLLFVMPLAILFLFPNAAVLAIALWFWLMLLVSLGLIWLILGRRDEKNVLAATAAESHVLLAGEEPEPVREVMDVRMGVEQSGVQVFRGRLRESAAAAYMKLKQAFGANTVPLLQEDRQMGAAIYLMPKPVEAARLEKPVHYWVNWLLLGLTILTTTWAGALNQGVNLLQEPGRFAVGLPYSLGLLGILGVHELGHFFAARRHGMNVTPPYFIPVPFALGTFGAFIKMRSPPEDRHALFDVAVAGPLAGLAVAIPALLIGLHSSEVLGSSAAAIRGPLDASSAGSSILFALLAKLALGPALLEGNVLRLSPLAFAGWLGLVVTALNLLPIGQLDGGHIARSMFGSHQGRMISRMGLWTLFLLALFVWPALMTWAIIVFFIASGGTTPPLNDLTPITSGRRWLGYLSFLILALILTPLPLSWWNMIGIHRP